MHIHLPHIDHHALKGSRSDELKKSLKGMKFGLEKEGLRVNPADGSLAKTAHPKELGSALTHPQITTDYSEVLLEFVTGTHARPMEALAELEMLQSYTASVIGKERIWPLSMPCRLPQSDADIPLAYYGESHIGRLKTVYRRGLGFRYGRQMQTIAGVHFNMSFNDNFWAFHSALHNHPVDSDVRTRRDIGYFHTIRNFRRIQWIFMLLTGASPAVDESFRLLATDRFKVTGRSRIAKGSTTLRMSDLGYQSAAQESINLCFNHLNTYCHSLAEAVHQPWPTYEGLGLKDGVGFKQLNTAVLQIENEYYSSIRPKRVQLNDERPVRALINRGVEYLEVRAIDLNPFARNGISEIEACLITLLMTTSALADSPLNSPQESDAISGINARTTWAGRQPEQKFDQKHSFKAAAIEFLSSLDPLAESLDEALDTNGHTEALIDARLRLGGTCPLISDEIEAAATDNGHLEFGLSMADQHHEMWLNHFNTDKIDLLKKTANKSLKKEKALTSTNKGSFDDFVRAYVNLP